MTDPDHAAWNTTVRDHIDRLEARIAKQEEAIREAAAILDNCSPGDRLAPGDWHKIDKMIQLWLAKHDAEQNETT